MTPITSEEIDTELAVAREALHQDGVPYSDRELARLLAGLLRLPPVKEAKR